MLGRPLLCVHVGGGQVLRTNARPLLAVSLQRPHPKVAFPVRCEMLVESDEILWGWGGPTSAGFVFLVFLKST